MLRRRKSHSNSLVDSTLDFRLVLTKFKKLTVGMKCLVLIELDLNIALPSRAAGSATLHFPKLTLLFSSL